MTDHKTCSGCGKQFECKVETIAECQCSTISLTEAETKYISGKFKDCLCVNCLIEMKRQFGLNDRNL